MTVSSTRRRVALLVALLPIAGLSAGIWIARAETISIPRPLALAFPQQQQAVLAPQPESQPLNPESVRQQPTRPPQAPEPRQYLTNWIEQVPDIALPEDGDAFRRLKTDEEREQFIQSFWLRRDPTPNTVENEFQNEYYRRIVVANQRYGTPAGVLGWRTDRGRIFVKLGEPDEVETHAQGDPQNRAQTFPIERWRYRFVEGIGVNVILEFVDAARDGSYRLTYDPAEKNPFFGTERQGTQPTQN